MGLAKKIADACERALLGPREGQGGADLDDELRDLTNDDQGDQR